MAYYIGLHNNYGNGQLLAAKKFDDPFHRSWDRNPLQDVTFYHQDALGSVALLTDRYGNVSEKYEYDVWGKAYEGGFKDEVPGFGNKTNAYGFTGQRYEPQLRVYSFPYRDYNPGTMRWLTEDPIKDGENWYQYCWNDPADYIDPDGQAGTPAEIVAGAISGAAWGLVSTVVHDVINHQKSSVATYAGNILGGAAGGAALGASWNPYAAAAVSSVVSIAVTNSINKVTGRSTQNLGQMGTQLAIDTALGGTAAKVAGEMIPRGPGAPAQKLSTALVGKNAQKAQVQGALGAVYGQINSKLNEMTGDALKDKTKATIGPADSSKKTSNKNR